MDSRKKALRQRGWSIQSEGTTQSSVHTDTADNDNTEQQSNEEKVNLLQSITASHSLLTNDDDDDDSGDGEIKQRKQQPLKNDAESDMDQSDDDDKAETPIVFNKLKRSLADDVDVDVDVDDPDKEEASESADSAQKKQKQRILTLARSRLSKWAARLFDPDRPKGLIETPKVIPLNDEFLKDFGKRTQEYDKAMGVHLEIDHAIVEEQQDGDDAPTAVAAESAKTKASSVAGRKVKINNLAFTTSEAALLKACKKYGPVESIILLMNPDRKNMNVGRAFVTFETEEAADACAEQMTKLDGRPLRITAAGERPSGGGTTPSKSNSRYWVQDISTKCFRCGQVGHMEINCPNPPLQKACPFCAKTDHDIRDCPIKAICFNCGVPGHISRDCRQPRGMPPRRICSLCFQSGHSKYQCRRGANVADNAVTRQAVCMVCGETGHFLCQQMKWFFGQEGVTCCNCGRAGHIGAECDRPNFEACMRNDDLAGQEVARASTYAEGEAALDPGRNQNNNNNDPRGRAPGRDDPRGRGRDMERGRRQMQHAHSMPPERRGGNGGSRSSSPPPPNRGNGRSPNNNNDPRGRGPGRDDRGRGGRGGGGSGDFTITNDNQNNSRGYSVTVVQNNSKSDNTPKSKKADNSNSNSNKKATSKRNDNNNKGKNPSPKNDNNTNNNSNKGKKDPRRENAKGNKKSPPKGNNSNPPPKAGKRKR